MLLGLIVFCEVAFWVLLAAGLATRYLLGKPRAGTALLVCAPLVDLVLLAASVADLRGGGQATVHHGLAAIYLGVSVGFGHQMMRCADGQFTHRVHGAPRPARRTRTGRARARHELAQWLRHLLAWGTGIAVGGLFTLLVGRVEAVLPALAPSGCGRWSWSSTSGCR